MDVARRRAMFFRRLQENMMAAQKDLFTGDDPFQKAREWLSEAEASEPNDANSIALPQQTRQVCRMCAWFF